MYIKSVELYTGNIKATAHKKKIVANPITQIKDKSNDISAYWACSNTPELAQFLCATPKPTLEYRVTLLSNSSRSKVTTSSTKRKVRTFELKLTKYQANAININAYTNSDASVSLPTILRK